MTPESLNPLPDTFPVRDGNDMQFLLNGCEIFPAMLTAIRAARSTITFETFIYWSGEVGDEFSRALASRAASGVDVRVILDWVGCLKLDHALVERMVKAGVQVRQFRPLTWHHLRRFNHRSHRKILVVDGQIGFVGGVGIADKWAGNAEDETHWRDNHYRVTGPVVNDLQRVFFTHWDAGAHPEAADPRFFPEPVQEGKLRMQVLASAPASGRCRIRDEFLAALGRARQRIGIVTPYFVPGRKLLAGLRAARRRGVEIEIITCGEHIDRSVVRQASRHRWGDLLRMGIRIHEFEPTLIHTKTLIVDEAESLVGSANFDCRSSLINDEVNLRVEHPAVAARHWELFEEDRWRSRLVTIESWQERGLLAKTMDLFAYQLRDQL